MRTVRDIRAGDGETIAAQARREVVLLVDRPELSITWSRYGAGEVGTDLHVHRKHFDAFYVLTGELTLPLGPAGEPVRLVPGGLVAIPPDVAHAFFNDGPAEATWLNFHVPDAGFANYLRGLRDGTAAEFDSSDPPADGGRPASDALVAGPGEGERLSGGGLGKAALPELFVAEWPPDAVDPAGWDQVLDLAPDLERVLTLRL